uniref:Uncharacterized protein n=1 Tax=Arundo donax TaxID=35708 RepID=A0A0A9AFQ0_ARUDO
MYQVTAEYHDFIRHRPHICMWHDIKALSSAVHVLLVLPASPILRAGSNSRHSPTNVGYYSLIMPA